ncbi:mitochondrial ribosomal protein L46 [Xylocopa sonorina]|uniref:mitochondrial ribosomal protein L46 n=1 Tax=Xylocopa sonorina TaxID=1818115 RepID=UPI00403AA81A
MMLRRILILCTSNNKHVPRAGISSSCKVMCSISYEGDDIPVEEKWDLLSAVCIERHPVITKPMRDIEAKYQKMLERIEFENSVISDFEVQNEKEKSQKEGFKIENITSNQTIRDLEDSWEEELAKFTFASRASGAEEDNAVVSLKRKLEKNLVLLVEQKIGNSNLWIPPQSIRKPKETMIQTAYRTVQELCGNNVRVKFYGYAPIGFYQYKYPRNLRDQGKDGAKIFYFLAKYISGSIPSSVNHCWLDRKELKTVVHPDVQKTLSKFLLPD